MTGILDHLAAADHVFYGGMLLEMGEDVVDLFIVGLHLFPHAFHAKHKSKGDGVTVGVEKSAALDAVGGEAQEFVAQAAEALELEAVFENLPVEADDLFHAGGQVIGGYVLVLQAHLACEKVVHALGKDHAVGMEFFLTGPDTHRAAIFHKHLFDQDAGGDEAVFGIVAGIDGLLNLSGQPVVEFCPENDHAFIRFLPEMIALEVDAEGRLPVHEGEPAVVDEPLPSTILLLPIVGHECCQPVAPEHPSAHVFRAAELAALNEQEFHVVSGQGHGGTQAGHATADHDTVEFFVHAG